MTKVFRVTIAKANVNQTGNTLQMFGYDATLFESVGFGKWGKETGVTIEAAIDETERQEAFLGIVADMLAVLGEQSAYMTTDGRFPCLVYADERVRLL